MDFNLCGSLENRGRTDFRQMNRLGKYHLTFPFYGYSQRP